MPVPVGVLADDDSARCSTARRALAGELLLLLLLRCIHQNEIDVNDKLSEQTTASSRGRAPLSPAQALQSCGWLAGSTRNIYDVRSTWPMAGIRTSTE